MFAIKLDLYHSFNGLSRGEEKRAENLWRAANDAFPSDGCETNRRCALSSTD